MQHMHVMWPRSSHITLASTSTISMDENILTTLTMIIMQHTQSFGLNVLQSK